MAKIIPCIHNNFLLCNDNLTPLPHPKILIALSYVDITRLVYHVHDHNDDQQTYQTHYLPLLSTTTSSVPTDPFCLQCRADVVSNLTSVGYSTNQVDSILISLRNEARDILKTYKEGGRHVDRRGRGNVIGGRVRNIARYHDKYCESIEEVNEWLMWANEQLGGGPKKRAATWAVDELDRVDGDMAGEDDCMVCLEELKKGEKVVKMPCQHEFHEECIVTWLENSHVCPLCRFELPLDA